MHPKEEKKKDTEPAKEKADDKKDPPADAKDRPGATNQPVKVVIDLDGLASRVWEVPVPPGNYGGFSVNDKKLFWISHETTADAKQHLMTLEITNDEPKPKTLVEDIKSYQLSHDGKKLLVRKGDNFHVEDAATAPPAKWEKA